jgi:hypothetical protein
MEIFFNKLLENKLTPNQYYAIYSIKNNTDSQLINLNYEKRSLIVFEWLDSEGKLTEKSENLLNEIEEWFTVKTTKTSKKKLGENFKELIEKYREKFPSGSHNGRPLRTSYNNTKAAFDKFFGEYKYDWDIIMKATDLYLSEQENQNYKYCKNSRYFVIKNTNESTLADYCELVLSGKSEINQHFEDKVV